MARDRGRTPTSPTWRSSSTTPGTGVRATSVEPGLSGGTEFSTVRFGGDEARAATVDDGTAPLIADDIAETMHWVTTLPAHVNINVVEMMPVAQAFGPLPIVRLRSVHGMSDDATITVSENAEADRYEIHLDGALGGLAQYVRRNGRTYFVHTEIDPAFGGRGLGGKLVKFALDTERAAGRPIVPLCPFVKAYVERKPEYQDLVDGRIVAAIDTA